MCELIDNMNFKTFRYDCSLKEWASIWGVLVIDIYRNAFFLATGAVAHADLVRIYTLTNWPFMT